MGMSIGGVKLFCFEFVYMFYTCFYGMSRPKKNIMKCAGLFPIPSCSMEIKQELGGYNDMNLRWKF